MQSNQSKRRQLENTVRYYRDLLKLSQSEMAKLFYMSRSTYAMMERGQRTMPAFLLRKLVEWGELARKQNQTPSPCLKVEDRQQAECQQLLKHTQQELHFLLCSAERSYERLHSRYQVLIQKLAATHLLHDPGHPRKMTARLHLIAIDCQEALARCSLKRQVKLQIRIEGLKRQLEVVEGLME